MYVERESLGDIHETERKGNKQLDIRTFVRTFVRMCVYTDRCRLTDINNDVDDEQRREKSREKERRERKKCRCDIFTHTAQHSTAQLPYQPRTARKKTLCVYKRQRKSYCLGSENALVEEKKSPSFHSSRRTMTTIGNHLFQPSGDNAVRTSISFIASSSSRLILRGHDTEGECCYLIFDFHVEICIEMK